jgi:hypothetical protein
MEYLIALNQLKYKRISFEHIHFASNSANRPADRFSFSQRQLYTTRSAAGHLLQLFRVASPLHRDLCGGVIDVTQIDRREFD